MVSFNTKSMTLNAIRTLLENANTNIEVIICDNASEDGSAQAIEKAYPQVKVVRSETNIGFAAANNMIATSAKGQ